MWFFCLFLDECMYLYGDSTCVLVTQDLVWTDFWHLLPGVSSRLSGDLVPQAGTLVICNSRLLSDFLIGVLNFDLNHYVLFFPFSYEFHYLLQQFSSEVNKYSDMHYVQKAHN